MSTEVPPPGYLAEDAPLTEGKRLSCPHNSCDGMTFDTANQAHLHEADWHYGPYTCECGQKYAARPALLRHGKRTGHVEKNRVTAQLAGRKRGREGTEGPRRAIQVCLPSSSKPPANPETPPSPARSDLGTVVVDSSAVLETDLDPQSDGEPCAPPRPLLCCLEPCCSRFGKYYKTEDQFTWHVGGAGHTEAVKMSCYFNHLRKKFEQNVQARVAALRDLRCDAAECPLYGVTFMSGTLFYGHLYSETHQRNDGAHASTPTKKVQAPQSKKTVRPMKEKQREELVMKSVESIVQDNGKQAPRFVTCTTKGCPGEGKVFGNGGAFARHLNSAQHTDAFDAAFKRGKKRPQRLQTPEREHSSKRRHVENMGLISPP